MKDKMPSAENIIAVAKFGTKISQEMMVLFADRVIEFREERKDLQDLIPRGASISALTALVGMIATTDVLEEEIVIELVKSTFQVYGSKKEEYKNEVKH